MKMMLTRTALAPVMWGTTYVTITQLLPPGRPLLTAAARVVPAGVALLAVAAWRSPWRPRGREWVRTIGLGLANFGLFFPLLIAAVQRLPGGVAAAAGGVQPLLVSLMTARLERRPMTTRAWAVGVAALVGVALVVVRPGAAVDAVGVVCALAANVSFAAGVVATRRSPAHVHRLADTGWQLLVAAVVLVPLAFAVDGVPDHVDARAVAGVAYLSLAATAAAFVLWFRGIATLPTVAPPLLGLASPLVGATAGWLVLGQRLSAVQLAGFAITIGAIATGAVLPARTPSLEPASSPGDALPPEPRPPQTGPRQTAPILRDEHNTPCVLASPR